MIGFSFKGIHSSDFNIGVRSINRSFLPSKRTNEITIPGRSGTLELNSNEYEKRTISLAIGILDLDDFENFRLKVRDIAVWLSGNGNLIFDDEKDKCYKASVNKEISLQQFNLQSKTVLTIDFICQPFAESKDLNKISSNTVGTANLNVENKGTANTQAVIVIKNIGTNTINNVRITRKVVI